MTPNPFTKQYLMTAGPTPVPPAVSQAMAAPMLYHRAPAFDELYERVLGQAAVASSARRTTCSRSPRAARARWSPRSPTSCAPATRSSSCAAGKFGERWIQLGEAYGADLVRYEPGWGERLDPAEYRPPADRERGRQGRVRDAQRDLDRHRARRPGDRRGRQRHDVILVVDAVSGPRRDRAAPGRVGRRRRRRRLAEGADVPARPRVRVGLRARARVRRRSAAKAATTSTGAAPPRASARARARSRPPCRCSSGSTSRSA